MSTLAQSNSIFNKVFLNWWDERAVGSVEAAHSQLLP